MTVLDRNPTNKDLLQSTKFRLNFSNLPGITYFCQMANIPGLSLTEIPRNTPFIDLYSPGEKLQYDTLNINFLVDENMVAWIQLHDWMRALTFPTDFREYLALNRLTRTSNFKSGTRTSPQYADGSMTIYTNKNNPNLRINFKDLFPTVLGTIQFTTSDNADNVIQADASFRFSYYDIEKV